MLKTYKTLVHSSVIKVDTKDGVRSVYLRNGFLGQGSLCGGVFRTDDPELQKGIESHPRFKSGFHDQIWTDDVEPKVKVPKAAPKKEAKAEPEVKKKVETKE